MDDRDVRVPPLGDASDKWKDDAKVSALVTKLAARRFPIEEAQKEITDFLAGSAAEKAMTGKLLFAGLFDTLNAQRLSVMNGLERVMRKQREERHWNHHVPNWLSCSDNSGHKATRRNAIFILMI